MTPKSYKALKKKGLEGWKKNLIKRGKLMVSKRDKKDARESTKKKEYKGLHGQTPVGFFAIRHQVVMEDDRMKKLTPRQRQSTCKGASKTKESSIST